MSPDFSPGLSMQMSQRMEMVMTPQMIQSMEMLQLPLMALEQKIQQELIENPALELAEMRDEGDEASFDGDEEEAGEAPEAFVDDELDLNENLGKVDELDYDWDSYYEEVAPRRVSLNDEERFDLIENAPGREMSFPQYLESQLTFMNLSERERKICTQIIYNLDPAGYLTIPLSETIPVGEELPPSEDELEDALEAVQSLDPPGVGSRNVRECLLRQIDALGENHHFERELVRHHLEDLAANRLPLIARGMGATVEDVKRAAAFVRTLNPHPGLDYGSGGIAHVQPDVIAELNEEGELIVTLIGGAQPDISDMFMALFDTTKRGRELREKMSRDPERAEEFKQMREMLKVGDQGKVLRDKYQSARWLITAIAQRERTLLRVAQDIAESQKEYLVGQSDAPAPLMMQDVADRVGIDISTVSRAVRDKYIDTPIGLKPLRMFFTRAVGGSHGNADSSNVQIMNQIRDFINAEDKKKPLKDDEIQDMLEKSGMSIKRRTVAKYRANLGFPSHSQRREF